MLKNELSKQQLMDVTGGNDGIEELDWKSISNIKQRPKTDSTWSFSAEGNVEGQYFKKIEKAIVVTENND